MRAILLRTRKEIKTDVFKIKFKGNISFVVLPKCKLLVVEPLDIKVPISDPNLNDRVSKCIDSLCLDFIYNNVGDKKIDSYIESVKVQGVGGKVWKRTS